MTITLKSPTIKAADSTNQELQAQIACVDEVSALAMSASIVWGLRLSSAKALSRLKPTLSCERSLFRGKKSKADKR